MTRARTNFILFIAQPTTKPKIGAPRINDESSGSINPLVIKMKAIDKRPKVKLVIIVILLILLLTQVEKITKPNITIIVAETSSHWTIFGKIYAEIAETNIIPNKEYLIALIIFSLGTLIKF